MSRASADARLGRLLAIVPWIAAHDGPAIVEVCRRFGVSEKELLTDLELLFMCGLYPFTPDVLIDVNIADGRVWISMADYFRRPLRLDKQEALALMAAGRAFLEVPGADPEGALATALDKVAAVLGLGPDDGLEVELAPVPPDLLETLRRAAARHEKVGISYYSYGRDSHSERVVHPWRVFNSGGQWYVQAWCEAVSDERNFRLDRITAAVATGEIFEPPKSRPRSGGPPSVYHPDPTDPLWVLDLEPPAHWVAEQYPNEAVESRPGGVLRVFLRAGQPAWMERLLLRGGPHIRVVQGDEDIRRGAAARVLARYSPAG